MTVVVTSLGTAIDTTGSTCVLSGLTVPAGSLIFVTVRESVAIASGTISDSAGNAWITIPGAASGGTAGFATNFYTYNSLALSAGSITYTKNTALNGTVLSALYATGIQTTANPIDNSVTAGPTTSAAAANPPSITSGIPSISGDLLIGVTAAADPTTLLTYTTDTGHGWAVPPTFVASTAALGVVGGGSQVNSGTGATTFAPTFGTPANSGGTVGWVFGFLAQSSSKSSKINTYNVLAPADIRVSKINTYNVLAPADIRVSKIVGYVVLAPVPITIITPVVPPVRARLGRELLKTTITRKPRNKQFAQVAGINTFRDTVVSADTYSAIPGVTETLNDTVTATDKYSATIVARLNDAVNSAEALTSVAPFTGTLSDTVISADAYSFPKLDITQVNRRSLVSGATTPALVVDQVTRRNLVSGGDTNSVRLRLAGVTRRILALANPPLAPLFANGPIPLFPALPEGFPLRISPVMDTIIGTTKSLRETRIPLQIYPIWDIELLFEELRDQTQNQTVYVPFAGYQQYMELVQAWLMMYGQTGVFADRKSVV